MITERALSKKEAVALLWNRGVLSWKLDATQKELYEAYKISPVRQIVWACSRRLGKSYLLCILAIEACLQRPNVIVKYCSPTQKMVKLIIKPIIRDILRDCPKELKPEFKTGDNIYRFPNGSEIQLAGTDAGNAENLRGGQADLCVVDEAGFADGLEYIVQSILFPTMTMTGGKIIMASTPPVSPDHDFCRFIERAETKGGYIKKTIYDNPRLTKEQLQSIIDEYGGTDSVQFRREYLCEIIKDENYSVVPEFTEALKAKVVKAWPRPAYFDRYVSMDLGLKDLTVVLFGYWDFPSAKLIIEDEFVVNGQKLNTTYLADAIKRKEQELYKSPLTNDIKPAHLRVSDNNLIVINDLLTLHQLEFLATAKDDKVAALNNMRILIEAEQVIIHPKCTSLIRHLSNAVWAKNKKTYARSADDGHFDAVDALAYLVRNLQKTRNPFPKGYGASNHDTRMANPSYPQSLPSAAQAVKNLFTPRKSLRRR